MTKTLFFYQSGEISPYLVTLLNHGSRSFLLKKAITSLFFLYFRLFNTVDSKQMFNKFCRWLDTNRGPLVLEATALPTEPHNHCPPDSLFDRDQPQFSNLFVSAKWLIVYNSGIIKKLPEPCWHAEDGLKPDQNSHGEGLVSPNMTMHDHNLRQNTRIFVLSFYQSLAYTVHN